MLLFGFCCYLYSLGSQIIAESCFLVNSGNKKASPGKKRKELERPGLLCLFDRENKGMTPTTIPVLIQKENPLPAER